MAGMNPLFLGLIVAGVVLVACVLLYNWLQERRVRRRIDAAFRKSGGTAQGVTRGPGRIEPMLNADDSESSQSVAIETAPADDESLLPDVADEIPDESFSQVAPATRAERLGLAPDPDIECVALLQPAQAASTAALGSALTANGAKPVRWLGRRGVGTPWQLIDATTQGPWHEIAACLLLADRSGAPLIPPASAAVQALAGRYQGAAKPTGAGGGDLILCVFAEQSARDAFARAAELRGMIPISVRVDRDGVLAHPTH